MVIGLVFFQREAPNNRYPQIAENTQLKHKNTDTANDTNPSNNIENIENRLNNKNRNRMEIFPMVLLFNNISMQIAKEWKQLLKNNPYFNIYLPLAAFKNFPSIGKQLIRADLNKTSLDNTQKVTTNNMLGPSHRLQPPNEHTTNKNRPGFNLCNSIICIICKYHTNTSQIFKSERYKHTYPILNKVGCLTFNIIYLITCNKCHIQYIGETGRTCNKPINET